MYMKTKHKMSLIPQVPPATGRKATKGVQVPILEPGGGLAGSIAPQRVEAVKAIEADCRAPIGELLFDTGMQAIAAETISKGFRKG